MIQCLWTINGVLGNIKRLACVTISCIKIINSCAGKLDEKGIVHKLNRSVNILGLMGREVDFENDRGEFAELFYPRGKWRGKSVSGLIADTILPFTAKKQPLAVRKRALESLGDVCQTHPPLFLEPRILAMFDIVFEEKNDDLEELALAGFKAFFFLEERRSEVGAEDAEKDHKESTGRLEVAAYFNHNDGYGSYILPGLVIAN